MHMLKLIVELEANKQKRVKLEVDGHSNRYTTTRYIWSNTTTCNTEIILKELSADKDTISNWFKTGNAFANIAKTISGFGCLHPPSP